MADATFFLPKEMNYIECEHFYNCLVRKLTRGLCILETLQVPGEPRGAHTLYHVFMHALL